MSVLANDIISKLKKEILTLNGFKSAFKTSVSSNQDFFQQHFPSGIFPAGAVHEFLCSSTEIQGGTNGFIFSLISSVLQHPGIIMYISHRNNIFPSAVNFLNITPQHIIFIHPENDKELLWITEESMKCNSVKAVIAETSQLNFTHTRRFQLAVENSNVTGFIIHHTKNKPGNNTCVSRWQVSSVPSQTSNLLPGVGFPRWKVELQKIRNGKPGEWIIEWNGEKLISILQPIKSISEETWKRKTG